MGFQGQLSSVNLTDIFQTLNMNRQTGTLSITGPVMVVHVYFEQGQVAMSSAPSVNGRPYLLDALIHKGTLASEKADEIAQQLRSTGQPLRDLLLANGAVADYELDEMCAWCIEELVCPVFEWQQGDFTFTDGQPINELASGDVVAMGATMVQTTQLIMEATRRMDEWKRIREVITDQDALYIVDNDGRANLKNVQTDPEMLKVLRYLDGRHTLDAIAMSVGVTRFDTFAIVAQLVLAGVARPKVAQEIVDDAVALREQGEIAQAKELLENSLRQAPIPEVMRPLAECCVQLNQAPRAVELYLELIQMAQDQGDLPQALKDLDTVIGLSPDDPDLQFERAQVQGELGQVEAAATSYTTAAQAYLARRDIPRAIDACHRAKNLLPRAPEPHRYLAKAYLQEGQTENAIVEYKSLWHALLTGERPKKAIDTLRSILDSDCKYNNVKDQVLSHAQNSEAIKTSKAARILVYLVILVLVGAAGAVGYEYYNNTIKKREGENLVSELENTVNRRMQELKHKGLLDEIGDLRGKYGNNAEVVRRLDTQKELIEKDFEVRAASELSRADALREAGKYEEAIAVIADMKGKFLGTQAVTNADIILEAINTERIKAQVGEKLKEAETLWTSLDWDRAAATLQSILDRKDLPTSVRDELAQRMVEWSTAIKSAQKMFERAQRIEQLGAKREALLAYRRASGGEGQAWVDKARERTQAIELDIAHEKGKSAQVAAARGDDQQTFTLVDEITALAKDASSHDVGDYLATLDLPFTLQIDSHHVGLTIRRAGTSDQQIAAPAGVRGSWSYRLIYHISEAVAIQAARSGFAPQVYNVSIQARKTQGAVTLVRGPRWRTQLSGVASASPIIAGKVALLPTDRSTLEVIDPVLGANQAIVFPNNIAQFNSSPFVFQDRAYSVLGDHVFSVDVNSRIVQWSWPENINASANRLTGQVWVQEHEIKPGQLLVFAATFKAGLVVLEVDPSGRAKPYPRLEGNADITGAPVVDHIDGGAVLYLPAGNNLMAFDISSITEVSAPRKLYTVNTQGDLIGRPVKSVVGGRAAMLVSDMSGLIMAIDADPRVPDTKRVLGSWPITGTVPTTPVCVTAKAVAYVAVAEGRVMALDLSHPGQLLWRYPLQGTLGAIVGTPVVGAHGVYLADANGVLRCLDPQTGSERWKADLGSPAVGGPLAHDGRVFVPLRTGHMVCFEEGDD
jgi:tetratricopeptide (TPR) repeat protein